MNRYGPTRLSVFAMLLAFTSAASADTFVCSQTSIRVFADDAGTGIISPLRVIEGAATQVNECYGLALDGERRELWVAGGDVLVFASDAQGNVPPSRSIPMTAAQLGFAVSVAIDRAANEVFVATAGGLIHTFPRTATGGAPTRTMDVSGSGVGPILGLAIDRSRDEVVIAAYGNPAPLLAAFARTATGTPPPVRTPTPLATPGQIAIDAGRDELYVISGNSVLITRAGQALATFTNNGLVMPYGLAIRADRQVLVGDQQPADSDPLKRFAAHPNGNAAPLATILNGSAAGRTVYGIATSSQAACADGNTASCLFRDGFE